MMKSEVYKPGTFFYFAYGGNLLTFRIHMHSPSAEFVSIARVDYNKSLHSSPERPMYQGRSILDACRLQHSKSMQGINIENFRLDFIKYNRFWGGPAATLVPTANAHAWGVIYRLHKDDMISLDDQKGIDVKKYYVKYLDVLTPYMGIFTCRAYIQKVNPLPRGDNDEIPTENWPSWTYKQILLMGAKEHELPEYYIKGLKRLQDNGEEGWLRVSCLLIRYGRDQNCECPVPGRIPRIPLKLELNKQDNKNKTIKKGIQF